MRSCNILLIFTGGTINTIEKDGYLTSGGEEPRKKLVAWFDSHIREQLEKANLAEIKFSSMTPFEILSENLDGNYIKQMSDVVERALSKPNVLLDRNVVANNTNTGSNSCFYDGIIIMCGTDSLPFITSTLGLLFGDAGVPIVTVSGGRPLSDSRTNGYINFANAVKLIVERQHTGVYCAYENDGNYFNGVSVFPAVDVLCVGNYTGAIRSAFDCYDEPDPSVVKDRSNSPFNHRRTLWQKCKLPAVMHCPDLSKASILYLHPYPGMKFPRLQPRMQNYQQVKYYDAVVMDTYHSGTFPMETQEFKDFVEDAKAAEVPIYVAGVREGLNYDSTKAYETYGIKVLPPITGPAAYMMLWLHFAEKNSSAHE
ncbi:MAG: asparaginase domain-containing protein [Lachnospiraceae bacterium]|nr:asparaginase domain-containing protein [Lachnospiraceae bacterium]